MKARFFLFADDGYPPYGTTIVGMQKMVKELERPEVVAHTYDHMVGAGLLKADVDFRQAFTTQFVRDLRVLPLKHLSVKSRSAQPAA